MFSLLKSFLLPPALVLLGLVIIFGAYNESKDATALADHGKTVVATIENVEWKEKKISGREKGFKIDIQFVTEDKQTISKKLSVSKEMGKNFRDGNATTITVKYLPENPQTVVLEGETDSSSGMYGLGAAMVVAGVGIFLYRRRSKGSTVAAA